MFKELKEILQTWPKLNLKFIQYALLNYTFCFLVFLCFALIDRPLSTVPTVVSSCFCWWKSKKEEPSFRGVDNQLGMWKNALYYMEESVLLGTKPLVDSIRHFIRYPSGVFSVSHLCECRIVQWRHDSRLLLLLNWFLHIIKRTLHGGEKIWILCSRGKNNISRVSEGLR